MGDYAVEMINICKGFGGVSVLKNVNFQLKKGEIHALVGGNGAGKSTLMKIMTGVYSCDSGEIRIDGQPVKINSTEDSKECGIGMIFQELSLIPTLTVEENIYLNHELKEKGFLNKKEMRKNAEALLKDLEIDVDVTKKIQKLEVGVCQLVEIAKALSVERKVLIMDEPTASLTDEETKLLFKIMRRLQSRGVSIVYISHRMKEILEISDTISVLRNGEIVKTASTKEMTLDSIITHMMGENAVNSFVYKQRKVPVSNETMLKERRPLVLVVRETPLSTIHLRNLTLLSECGAVVLPASPSFYSRPADIEALCDTVAVRAVRMLGVASEGYEWGAEEE